MSAVLRALDAPAFRECERGCLQCLFCVVEENDRIEVASSEMRLEVKVLGGGAPGTSGESDDLSGFHVVTHFDEIL